MRINKIIYDKKFLIIILIFMIVCLGCICINQNITINNLKLEIQKSQENHVLYNDDVFNYLALGNSITIHKINDYWWSGAGMAASTIDKDYFHIVKSYLENENKKVYSYAVGYSIWEVQSNDRAETFEIIDPYLSNKLDLVTIQLSENVNDFSTFKQDFEELINYVKNKCPNAKIIIIDDFWHNEYSKIKSEIAINNGAEFIDLSEIRGNNDYECGIGTIVYDINGNEHVVNHSGVARHPNDKAMAYIANAIIKKLVKN